MNARLIAWAETRALPDWLIRFGIRRLNRQRLAEEARRHNPDPRRAQAAFVEILKASPIAIETDRANEEHYELPPLFFEKVLGRHLKYSCCYWRDDTADLDAAEAAMLELSAERAEIEDGMDILDLGCGWGSFSLWAASRFAGSQILAVSNSVPQRQFIEAACRSRGLKNVQVLTADMNRFQTDRTFDRVVSIEMFEHMRNYQMLLARIAQWLRPGGQLFVHVFCHRRWAYLFETQGERNWMGRYFFTGGLMPSDDLLSHFQDNVVLEEQWRVSGRHYQKTAEAWLQNLDRRRGEILPILETVYGSGTGPLWTQRWRIFFMACAELWGTRRGREWWVSHYRFRRP